MQKLFAVAQRKKQTSVCRAATERLAKLLKF
jgi:hypothetical protein